MRLSTQDTKTYYGQVDLLTVEKSITAARACEELQISYVNYMSWKKRQLQSSSQGQTRRPYKPRTSDSVLSEQQPLHEQRARQPQLISIPLSSHDKQVMILVGDAKEIMGILEKAAQIRGT